MMASQRREPLPAARKIVYYVYILLFRLHQFLVVFYWRLFGLRCGVYLTTFREIFWCCFCWVSSAAFSLCQRCWFWVLNLVKIDPQFVCFSFHGLVSSYDSSGSLLSSERLVWTRLRTVLVGLPRRNLVTDDSENAMFFLEFLLKFVL